MTITDLINHVDDSIEKSLNHASWIDESILFLSGFSTGVQRRLISNLCHLPKDNPVYLECGLYAGASFCAAMNNNPSLTACGIEDCSQDFGKPEIFEELKQNLEKYKSGCRDMKYIQGDCFKIDKRKVPNKVDIMYYDSVHSFEAQRDALPNFISKMNDIFLYVCDDFQWVPVKLGTEAGFEFLKHQVKIEKQWVLSDGKPDSENWHNDVFLAACTRL